MKIFKFGGASVKDSDGVKNLVKILNYLGQQQTLIVISAMGKTTNSLELLVKNYFDNKDDLQYSLNEVFNFHNKILDDLFKEDNHQIFSDVKEVFENLRGFLKRNKSPDYSFVYDQVVSFGEILSTKIINSYLNYSNIRCNWVDARVLIKTDSKYRDANLNWEITKASISKNIDTKLLNITQGFIASDANNFSTTLGREGSDYT
ncbi:MAG: aspartate kinase, partial [Flavobacteriaceae bacterium]|nr:aspartate kinase [Flavobacteriaceae bacterium]